MVKINGTISYINLTAKLSCLPISVTYTSIDGGVPSGYFTESIYGGNYNNILFTEIIDCGNEVSFADITGGTPLDSYSDLQTINGGSQEEPIVYDVMDGGNI